MKSFYFKIVITFCFAVIAVVAMATHNRAGEITYEQIDELTVRATITTYTKTSSTAADRDSVEISWGDGTVEFIRRINGNGDPLPNDIKVNYYVAEHSYPGRGTYTISMVDPNRVANILNVNAPNSVQVPFFIETRFTLLNPLFQGRNSSAILLQPPIDFSCVGQTFIHNANAFDPDGDSLAYEFTVPKFDRAQNVPEYRFPNEINPGENNAISLDEVTGSFVWDAPRTPGEYNIAFLIKEYRNGVLITSTVRDMQILVRSCVDAPPTIEAIESICVIAGETIELDVFVDDSDENQLVQLSATGGPFTFTDSPARIESGNTFLTPSFTGKFIWQTTCNHISEEEHQVVFRAVDNVFGDTTGLATLKTLRIKVVGPAPVDISAQSEVNSINVNWEQPYDCENAVDDYFLGFSVWRREGSASISNDSCTGGLDGSGYEEIVFITNENEDGRYFINDPDVNPGIIYCYRVQGEFARQTDANNPFNKVSSLPSEEICLLLKQDFPIITKVSVVQTDSDNGEIEVNWIKPLAEDLDTVTNQGPYRYQLLRAENQASPNFVAIPEANFITQNFSDPIDTEFIDSGLNTLSGGYIYQIEFYSTDASNNPSSPKPASSVFLTIAPGDQRNTLNWNYNVPWQNSRFEIYKRENTGFELLTEVSNNTYIDEGLTNGNEACYFIKSYGSYGIDSTPEILINDSQIACAVPADNSPPCIPELSASNICNNPSEFSNTQQLFNILLWQDIRPICDNAEDLAGYNIYYAQSTEDPLAIIETIDNSDVFNTEHSPAFGIAGCYAISSFDLGGNESALSLPICLDNCPTFTLPNTFTPNGDGSNDMFTPSQSQFIDKIEMKVFNRWGQKVFETANPNIDWDGTNLNGSELADGVYFYTCTVFEQRLSGSEAQADILTGYINLLKAN